jgi:S1-C subfamily serine protease
VATEAGAPTGRSVRIEPPPRTSLPHPPEQPAPGNGAAGAVAADGMGSRRERRLAAALGNRGPTVDLRPLRYRVFPRTALGISIAILCFSLGASLAGVVLYSYYEYRLTQNEDKVNALTSGIPNAVKQATDALKAQEQDAQNLINQQIAPLKSVLATGQTVQQLIAKVAPAVYFVHTLDANGQPSVGTAFAVASDTHQTLLLTSYTTVAAATRKPGPPLYVRHGGTDQAVTVYTWDPTNDLALIILPQGGLPTLTFASSSPSVGERVFAVSGLGAAGAAITQGFVADVSSDGIQHDATTGPQFQGGPLLDSNGDVVGILSRTYSPLGFQVADVWFAVPPDAACDKVLSCPNGSPVASSGSGAVAGT